MNLRIQESNEDIDAYFIVAILEDHLPVDPWYENSFPEVDKWCKETFGMQDLWGGTPKSGWKRMRNSYYFTDNSLRSMFVLRWS